MRIDCFGCSFSQLFEYLVRKVQRFEKLLVAFVISTKSLTLINLD